MHFSIEPGEFDQRTQDDARVGTGLAAGAAAVVAHGNLFDGETGGSGSH